MSIATDPSAAAGYAEAVNASLGLFSDINKARDGREGSDSIPMDEYTSELTDDEIIDLTAQWKTTYRKYYSDGIEDSQNTSFAYWIGKHAESTTDQVKGSTRLTDNKIFEAVETFIPIATRANPDPLVKADPNELGQKLEGDIKTALVYEADRLKLKKINKGVIRDWILCRLGLIKIGFDVNTQQTTIEKINPKRWMGDKDGHWDESCHFTGEWQAEKKLAIASDLIKMFPEKEGDILDKAGDKRGTKLEYIEWWYKDKDVFYTLDDLVVLGKFKNPHWNYDVPEAPPQTDPMGNIVAPPQPPIEGKNHFLSPKAPYCGLSIFTTNIQPFDDTSIIIQNIPLQDSVNNIIRQIDRNVEGMNNAMVVSDAFTDEQATKAASALRKGIAIRASGSDISKSVMRFPPSPLPADVYQSLQDRRNEIRSIFGTSASTPQGVDNQPTVRGKILSNQLDSTRIGGGVTEYLEQLDDAIYNWFVQIMFVHWTDPHFIVAAGSVDGTELVQIKNTDLALLQTLDITVKEGSLIPKDPLTQRNEAIDLWSAGAIDPKNFYKRLDFADPDGMATQLLTWQLVQKGALPPQAYLPNFGMGQPMLNQPPMGQPPMGAPGQMNVPGAGGVGGAAINPLGPKEQQPQPEAASPAADRSQSNQLIKSIPIK